LSTKTDTTAALPGSAYFLDHAEEAEQKATYAIIVDNEAGVLHRVVGLFAARGYNIESLTVAETDRANHTSRITVVTRGSSQALAQIRASGARAVLASGFDAIDRFCDAVLVDPPATPDAPVLRPPRGVAAFVLLPPEARDRIGIYRAAGYQGYLIKPLRRSSIISRLYTVIGQPAAPAAEPLRLREDERAGTTEASSGLRVLLAEDNEVNALLATALLRRMGCVVDRATTGPEAVEAASTAPYDLILMDVRMPGLDGLEATRRLRALGVTTPIAAVTANAFEDDRRACLEAGMNDFLTKPLAPAALNAAIARFADERAATASGRARRSRSVARPAALPASRSGPG